jgi:hypothetical protein
MRNRDAVAITLIIVGLIFGVYRHNKPEKEVSGFERWMGSADSMWCHPPKFTPSDCLLHYHRNKFDIEWEYTQSQTPQAKLEAQRRYDTWAAQQAQPPTVNLLTKPKGE